MFALPTARALYAHRTHRLFVALLAIGVSVDATFCQAQFVTRPTDRPVFGKPKTVQAYEEAVAKAVQSAPSPAVEIRDARNNWGAAGAETAAGQHAPGFATPMNQRAAAGFGGSFTPPQSNLEAALQRRDAPGQAPGFRSHFLQQAAQARQNGILVNNTQAVSAPGFSSQGKSIIRSVRSNQSLEMMVNTSQILKLDTKIPRAQVNNPDLLTVTPLSPNEVQISASKPGVTQVNLWDESDRIYTVDVTIYGDIAELQSTLRRLYPHSSVKAFRISSSLVLTGYVDQPNQVSTIMRLAEDYAPKVISNISVGGVQQIVLNVEVMEVSRTKLRSIGFDFANFNGDDFVVSSISGLISAASSTSGTAVGGGDTVRFGIVNDNNSFFGFLKALRQNDLLKVLAEPKLVTVSGRPASFNVGGEFPVLVPQSLGTVSIEYKKFGTQVDFMPIVLGNGNIRLEVRPRVSEIDPTRSVEVDDFTIPGLRVREVDTGVEMKAGQTLALAGLVQNRVEAQNKGIPYLADMPWVGAAFRAVEHTNNEIELLIMVRPELVDALDPHEVPPGRPGLNSDDPCDYDLFWNGHLEVPAGYGCSHKKGCNCPSCGDYASREIRSGMRFGPHPEVVPAEPQGRRVAPAEANEGTSPPPPPGSPSARVPRRRVYTQAAASRKPSAARSRSTVKHSVVQPRSTARELTPRRAAAPTAQAAAPTSADGLQPTVRAAEPINRKRSDNPAGSAATTAKNRSTTPPGLIGPVGYDVEE